MAKDGAIVGMALWNSTPADMGRAFAALDAGFSDGSLSPVVSTELPLADAPRAHKLIMEPGARGKIVLTV
jgi:NADPH2:quinone reductase